MPKLSEVLAEIQKIESQGGDATELRARVESKGYADRLPPKQAPQQAPQQPPEPTFLQNWGRPIAEAGGSLVGGALGIPGGLPGMAAGAALGGHVGGMASDYLTGSPAPPPVQQVLSAGFNSMGGPSAPAGKGPALLSPYAKNTLTGGLNLAPSADDVARSVSERGGTTTPGQRGPGMMRWIEGALESSPFAGPTMRQNRQQTTDIFGDIISELTPSATTRDAAGDTVAQGYSYNKDRAAAQVEDAYKYFDKMIEQYGGRAAKVPANALQDLSAQYKDLRRVDGGFAEMVYQDSDLRRAIESIDDMVSRGESPSYDVLKRLRTTIGKKIDFNSPGSEQIGLKSLYDTLTQDLAEGAKEIGGEAAQRAGQAADSMFRSMQIQLKALDPVFKFADTPTKLYDAVGRAVMHNPELARNARVAMGPNAWDTFRDTWIEQMTRATPKGQDLTGMAPSANTTFSFLSKLKQVSPEGYDLLTEGRREGMAVVERLAEMMKGGEQYLNRSNTANSINTSMFGGDLIGATGGALAGLATGAGPTVPMVAGAVGLISRPILSKLMAKAVTNKRLNDALIKVGRKYEQIPVGKDLIRALVVAGADEYDVNQIFGESSVPERGAANPPDQLF